MDGTGFFLTSNIDLSMFDLSRKIIFTHPQKCAGTTIEGLFGWNPPKYKGTDRPKYIEYFNKWKHASLDEHLNELRLIGEDTLNYFIFSCVRNPWDRAVSWYFHSKIKPIIKFKRYNPGKEIPQKMRAIQNYSFEEFILDDYERVKNGGFNALSTRPFIFSVTGAKPDLIIRHENYTEGLHAAAKKYGLDASTAKPLNANVRPNGGGYKEYYLNSELISVVAKMGADSISDFGYKF